MSPAKGEISTISGFPGSRLFCACAAADVSPAGSLDAGERSCCSPNTVATACSSSAGIVSSSVAVVAPVLADAWAPSELARWAPLTEAVADVGGADVRSNDAINGSHPDRKLAAGAAGRDVGAAANCVADPAPLSIAAVAVMSGNGAGVVPEPVIAKLERCQK
jgi:hypothetical protein